MSDVKITVTEAARNFADCVNRVRYQRQSFVLMRNGVAVARLAPAAVATGTGSEVAAALQGVALAADEAETWSQELKASREMLLPPGDKWPFS